MTGCNWFALFAAMADQNTADHLFMPRGWAAQSRKRYLDTFLVLMPSLEQFQHHHNDQLSKNMIIHSWLALSNDNTVTILVIIDHVNMKDIAPT